MDQSQRFVIPGQNRLLSALSRELQIRLLPRTEKVSLSVRQVLVEADMPISHVYFPLSGATSLVIALGSGETVEIATVGNEGMVGTPVFLGAERSAMRAICQVAGQALRMRSESFRHSLAEHPDLADMVRRYTQGMINQISRTTACNHVHSVPQRMSRWLLMTQDRVGADEFHLTQELLAHMLGVRRPSVTVAAGMLQRAGLIRYQRGRIHIVDRAGLEAASCECYESVRQDISRLLAVESKSSIV
jgi:CRP-like cAMP-binding protein